MIETQPVGLTGYRAIDWLREHRSIDIELERFIGAGGFVEGAADPELQTLRVVAT